MPRPPRFLTATLPLTLLRGDLDRRASHLHDDQHRARGEQQDRGRGREARSPEREGAVVDVELDHVTREVWPALRGRVDVGEDPREHVDQLERDERRDHARHLGQRDAPPQLPPVAAVDPAGLIDLLRQAEQPREEQDHAEAELVVDDDRGDRRQHPRGRSEPVLLEEIEADVAEQRVEPAVEAEEVDERRAEHGDGEDVRHEHDRPIEAPAHDALVQDQRNRKREHEHDRHRDEQQQVVLDGRAEDLVVEDEAVGVQLYRPGVSVVAGVHRRIRQAHQRVDEDEPDEGGCGRDQEVRAERAPQSLDRTAARAGQLRLVPLTVRVRHP
jgi:hypothetical protein